MDEQTFLSALREKPADELTWSALADWLEESAQGERAELVRGTRRLRATVGQRTAEREALARRVAALVVAGVRPVLVGFTNTIGMRFVLVEPGTFLMGSPEDEADREEDEAQHEVSLTRPFWLGVYPVTQGQWKAVMGTTPSYFSRHKGGKGAVKDVSAKDLAQFPVERVSWEDAQDFLKKLAAMKEERKSGQEYRLPTEAEWEYSCRGGHLNQDISDKHTFPIHLARPSSALCSTEANFNGTYPYRSAPAGPRLGRSSKVGSYPGNILGISDMHGNVWECCADRYGDYSGDAVTDPSGPVDGAVRVIRGGSWYFNGRFCRAADRGRLGPAVRLNYLGFRVAAVPRG